MFIELPNETRVNVDHIISYHILYNREKKVYTLWIIFDNEGSEPISFETEEEAKLALYALDRAIGVKPIIVRK